MGALIATRKRRLLWTLLTFILAVALALWLTWRADMAAPQPQPLHTMGDLMTRLFTIPALGAFSVLMMLTACATGPRAAPDTAGAIAAAAVPPKPFMAQVVGVQWLNPLQRRDYPTEWQLLWTLGLAKPNKDDDMVSSKPKKYGKLQSIGMIAMSSNTETFKGFHHKYVQKLTSIFRSNYFADPEYFYNVHSRDKTAWRELAGIHIEYALPAGKLDPVEAGDYTRKRVTDIFMIGNQSSSRFWTRATPPDVRVTTGGANAGFASLSAALDYLQAHPKESAWVMNWDAPNFPKDEQINENLVLLVLAGPDFNTERAALAHIGYPAAKAVADFEAKKGLPPRAVQAWQATFDAAVHNAGKQDADIAYVIHDANNTHPDSPDRIGALAQTLSTELVEFDFMKQTFNTPALLGEMGAGTALTNIALGIAYANHVGKNVLVAGTGDAALPTAVLVTPPAKARPVDHDARWFRARGENNAYLFWWGIRHDAEPRAQMQGYSQ